MSDATSLTEEFNTSARSFEDNGNTSLSMLLTKYNLLQRHVVTDTIEKTILAGRLFTSSLTVMKSFTGTRPARSAAPDEKVAPRIAIILGTLINDENVNYIPEHAPDDLAGVALDLIRRAERADKADFGYSHEEWSAYRNNMSILAATALEYADKFRDVRPPAGQVSTAQNVTPAKRIVLKQPENGA
jgi:hypothetical protein